MERRRCKHMHYIKAIRSTGVEKVPNVDSRGRPGLVFKGLKEIYDSKDVKRRINPSTHQLEDKYTSSDRDEMEIGSGDDEESDSDVTYSPKVRRRKKRKTDSQIFNHKRGDDDDESDSDITLKQLKKQRYVKKREVRHNDSVSVKLEYVDLQPEDESDLKETIGSWKSKVPKNLKGKKKSTKLYSQTPNPVISGPILDSVESFQSGVVGLSSAVKVDVSATEFLEPTKMISQAYDSSVSFNGERYVETTEAVGDGPPSESRLSLCCESEIFDVNEAHDHFKDIEDDVIMDYPIMISESYDSSVISNGEEHADTSEAVGDGPPSESQLSLLYKSEICYANEVCCDHFEDIDDEVILDYPEMEFLMDYPDMAFPQLADSPYTEDDDENNICIPIPEEVFSQSILPLAELASDMHMDNSEAEMSLLGNEISEVEVTATVPDSVVSDLSEMKDDIYEEVNLDLEASGDCNLTWVSNNFLNHGIVSAPGEDDLVSSQDPPLKCVHANVKRECGLGEIPLDSVDGSGIIEEEQCVSSPPDDGESDDLYKNQHCDSVDDVSAPETSLSRDVSVHMRDHHPPKRLLSTRKVISPTSQERLCQAMKGGEFIKDVDRFKCKEKLHFENTTEKDPSTKGQGAENTKVETPLRGLGLANRNKVILRPCLNTNKKQFPPTSNQKSSGRSRALPNFSTGTKSLQRFRDSAIAFSQRQMHDFECLATKLMQELNSMKCIVEGELHCATSPIKTMAYDLDEVKTAIKNARKTEERTRKWLSMMNRDCNRFCTIMKLSQKGDAASPDNTHKQKRKVTFADEAGGVLCHVKVFEDGTSSLGSQT